VATLIVGGAGFIGSHLVESLCAREPVTVFDNLSVGRSEHLPHSAARLVVGDALDLDALQRAAIGHDTLVHLAANPEARRGLEHPRLDLEQGTIATWNALEAARRAGVRRFVFASSGTVYGDAPGTRNETDLGHLPISLYGASKLAGEAMISAYAECFGIQGLILRFGNVVGPRATHGAILDFCKKLRATPEVLQVMGDGLQTKPYVHVTECVAGIAYAMAHAAGPLQVFNLAPSDGVSVQRLAQLCVAASPNPRARIEYTGGRQGWPGDVPVSKLCADKLSGAGFSLTLSSDQAVQRAVKEIAREVFSSALE